MSWTSRADRIDHDGPVTLWRQVADDLTSMIDAGDLPKGSRVPAEPELAELYGVARVTIRRAVAELRAEKRLTVVHGRGTFVT
jgi:GntR family transcriptional regulator